MSILGIRRGARAMPALLALAAAACAPGIQRLSDEETDPKLNATTFYEEGRIAFLAVDSRAASLVRKGDIFPLAFILVNKDSRTIRLNTESFTLRDSQGNLYPLVPYETFRRDYRQRLTADQRLSEPFVESTNLHLGIDRTGLSPYRPVPFPFFETGTGHANRFELPTKNYVRGFLYFPIPEGGLKDQVLELDVHSPDLQSDLFVKFRVP